EPHAPCGHARVDDSPVLPYPALVDRVPVDLAGQRALDLACLCRPIIRCRQVSPPQADDLMALVAQNSAQLVVCFQNLLGGRDHCHADQTEVEVAAESILACSESLPRPLALDDRGC